METPILGVASIFNVQLYIRKQEYSVRAGRSQSKIALVKVKGMAK